MAARWALRGGRESQGHRGSGELCKEASKKAPGARRQGPGQVKTKQGSVCERSRSSGESRRPCTVFALCPATSDSPSGSMSESPGVLVRHAGSHPQGILNEQA